MDLVPAHAWRLAEHDRDIAASTENEVGSSIPVHISRLREYGAREISSTRSVDPIPAIAEVTSDPTPRAAPEDVAEVEGESFAEVPQEVAVVVVVELQRPGQTDR